ncbi:MAG: LysR family transcriptional regulator [Janthinobacterium lividum]
MDRVDVMRAFTRVVERRSFAQAASDLGLPRSRTSEAVQQLERHLGVRLLARTTRKVTLTAEGEDYHRRCLAILAAIDEADAAATQTVPVGPLRIDVHSSFAQRFLLPGLPAFLARFPNVQLHIGEGDRLIDLIAEGVDCAIRVGKPADSGLVGRKLGMLAEGTFASPDYLARHGVPASPDDLEGHRMIGFVSSATRAVMPLEFQTEGGVRMVSLPVSATVSATVTNASLARLGLGLIQVPRYRVADDLAAGALVEVLAAHPPTATPVYLLYLEGRQLSPRVRIFVEWASNEITAELARP